MTAIIQSSSPAINSRNDLSIRFSRFCSATNGRYSSAPSALTRGPYQVVVRLLERAAHPLQVEEHLGGPLR